MLTSWVQAARYCGNVATALPGPQPVHNLLGHLQSPHNPFAGQPSGHKPDLG